jgi:hypothetical protein
VIALHQFRVGQWYPFRDDQSTVGDPKTTAAVGAMICLLGGGQLQNFNLRSELLRPRSTARFFGKLNDDGRLGKADEFYDNLDLDNQDFELPETRLEFRGPMPLGFRQLPVSWWPASRLYYLDYATPDDARALSPMTPLRFSLMRKGLNRTDKHTGEEFVENPDLQIKSIGYGPEPATRVRNARLRLRLQTLDQPQGYWLDTGILLGS